MERGQKIAGLFAAALELGEEDRSRFLADACAGDPSMLAEVKLLLGSDAEAEAGQFMRRPALDVAAVQTNAEPCAQAGQHLGRYEILSLIDEGGMGEVYRARDVGLGRDVAVKLVKGGLKTKEFLRRFRGEGQILANLRHPNIAQLLDVGTTADGIPFLVMEYVEGEPVTPYADAHGLSVPGRLELFRSVCAAVQHAHQNSVVHRDIKPSNILVTAKGEPKLLDFGIAKLLDSPLSAEGMPATATALRIMTPEYASPEQVKGEAVTTSSDVYSLGVLLYELLTGRRPYRLGSRRPEEIERAVCTEEPERPSTAAAGPRDTAEATPDGPRRKSRADAEQLRRQLRGDLDNILLMALRKEPGRRYASAAEFSEDIRRHLEGLPVRARKDTLLYRGSKFVRRHQGAVAAAAAVLLTLVGGIIATTWEARAALIERARAERRFEEVRKLAHSVMFEYHDAIATLPGSTPVRQKLVRDSLAYLDGLAQEAGGDASLQEELATAYLRVGDVQGRFSVANLGDTKAAAESYRKALAIAERVAGLYPKDAKAAQVLAACHERVGEISVIAGDTKAAAESYQKAIAILEASPSVSDDAVSRFGLAMNHRMLGQVLGVPSAPNLGDTAGAVEHLRKAVELCETTPVEPPQGSNDSGPNFSLYSASPRYGRLELLGSLYDELAATEQARGNLAEALEGYRKAAQSWEQLLDGDPNNTQVRRSLAVEYGNMATALLKTDPAGATPLYRKSLALYETLAAEDSNNVNAQKDLALGYRNMGRALSDAADKTEAFAYTRKALQILEQVVAKDPANAYNRRQLAFTHLRLSTLMTDAGDLSGAIAEGLRAVSICESLAAADPNNTTARNTLALSYAQLGKAHALSASRGVGRVPSARWREAGDWYRKSLEVWATLRAQGKLSGADAGKPDEVAREIAKCDAALPH